MKHEITHQAVIPRPSCSPQRIDVVVQGYKVSQILRTALEIELFTLLKRPCTFEEILNTLKTVPGLTRALLEALVALGLVKRSDERYEASNEAKEFLDSTSPLYQGHFIMLQLSSYDLWNSLPQALQGQGVKSQLRDHADVFDRRSTQAMAEAAMRRSLHRVVKRILKEVPEFMTADSLLDLGGGHGLYSVAFTQACPELKTHVFDLPQVIEVTKEFVAMYGASDKIHMIPGDFTKDDLGNEAYDIVFTSHVLYRYACNEELLRKLLRALKDGGILILSQWMKRKEPNLTSALWDIGLIMDGYTESALYTLDEFRSILTDIGFHVENIMESMVPYDLSTIVVCRKERDKKKIVEKEWKPVVKELELVGCTDNQVTLQEGMKRITDLSFKPVRKNQEGTIILKDDKGRTVIRRAHSFFLLKLFENEIWEMCNGKTTVEEMALVVSKKYGVKLEKARKEILQFLKKLKENDLIDWGDRNENSSNKSQSTCK